MTPDPKSPETIFCEAIAIESPEDRTAFLDQACQDNPDLRRELEKLIVDHFRAGDFLENPAVRAETVDQPITEKPGSVIGPYRLLQKIGEGGFGVVYMAEQTEPVERRVALKIIKPGMDTRQVIARFEAERQALAMMDHPNIAKILDGGTTDSGRPYFVMELVQGTPITNYCDQQRLSPRERLELFIPVCEAVQHAHQKGVIHRDLKPSNVLIALYDDRPVPKVIDFGVAKATSQKLTEKTIFTQYGQIVGTLEYMSPEQANLNQLDIDTRSDIYSLGVLLYELLTGATPFDRAQLRSVAFEEMLRILREEEPPKPSTRLSTSESLASIAANRHVEPKKLNTLVRGELDWIVMKSLEKDRARRYQTANGFANDIKRYLNDEQVQACPPSAGYRFRKFARRNKTVIATTSVVAAALVMGVIGTTWQAVRATSEHRTAELARREEADQRAKAEQQRDRAVKAEQRAEEQAEKERQQRAEAERQKGLAEDNKARAEQQRRLAEEQELCARRNLYAAHMNLARDAWDDGDTPRALDLLERHVPAPGEPDWRSFEWYYLLGLCNRDELTIPCGFSGQRPVFSPDGKVLASAFYHRAILLYDMDRRGHTKVWIDRTVEGPLAFSLDGRTLASVGGGEVKLWDITTGKRLRSFGEHWHSVVSIAFTPDGKRIVSTDGGDLDSQDIPGVIRVWDAATGEKLAELKGHTKCIFSIAMSPDGRTLVSAGSDDVRFWDLATGKSIEGPAIQSKGMVALSDKMFAVKLTHTTIGLCDNSTGAEIRRLEAPSYIQWMTFSADGRRLASTHNDSAVRLWDVETGKELDVYKGHREWVFFATFSPDGKRIASVSRDCMVKVWPVDGADPIDDLAGSVSLSEEQPGRHRMAISPDGALLAALKNSETVAILDVQSGLVRATMHVGPTVHALAFSPESDRLAVAKSQGLQIWDVETAKLVQDGPSDSAIWTIGFSPDGRWLAVGTEARQVEIRKADTLATQIVLPCKYDFPLGRVAFSPDGKTLGVATTGYPTQIHIWDVASWRLRASYEEVMDGWSKMSTDLAFSPDGKILAVSQGTGFQPRDGAATRLFDVTTGGELAVLRGDDAYHTAVAFSSDGKTIATASEEGKIRLWDLQTCEERTTLTWDGRRIQSLAFSPDGRNLVTIDSTAKLRLWRSASQRRIEQRERVGWRRRAAEYAAGGRWQKAVDLCSHILKGGADLLTGGADLNIRLLRGGALAELSRWEEAAADFEKAANSGLAGFRPWHELAVAKLGKDDREGFRDACANMLAKFGETTDATTAQSLCWTCVLQPQPDLDWGKLVALAALPFTVDDGGRQARTTLGAILFRAGLHTDALEQLGLAADGARQELHLSAAQYDLYFLAMVHSRLGHSEQARRCFDRADRMSKEPMSDESRQVGDGAAPQWFRRVTLSVLREGAESLLEGPVRRAEETEDSPESSRRALDVYTQALQRQAEAPLLWRLRAKAHQRLEHVVEAKADLARAEELETVAMPLHRLNRLLGPQATVGAAKCPLLLARATHQYKVRKDYDAAIRDCYLIFCLDITPREKDLFQLSLQAFQLFLDAQRARGTLDQAADDWRREFGEVSKFYRMRATLQQQRGEYEKAAADWRQAIRLHPQDLDSHLAIGEAHQKLGQWDQAIEAYGQAIRLRPQDVRAWYKRADSYLKLGSYDQAIADYDAAIRQDRTQPSDPNFVYVLYVRRAEAHLAKGEYEQVIADGEKMLQGPTTAASSLRAAAVLAKAYRSAPEQLVGLLKDSGRLEESRQCWRKCADVLESSIRSASGSPNDRRLLAKARDELVQLEQLFAQKEGGKPPDHATLRHRLGRFYAQDGQYAEALAEYGKTIDLEPGDATAYADRARANIALGHLEQAVQDAEQAVKLDPQLAWAYAARALVYARQGEHDKAKADWTEVLRLAPKDAGLRLEQGIFYAAVGKPDQAIAALDEAIRLDPGSAFAYAERGFAYAALGDEKKATADWQKVMRVDPAFVDRDVARAELEARKSHWKEASEHLGRALRLNPDDDSQWQRQGFLLLKTGDIAAYHAHCREYLDRFGDPSQAGPCGQAIETALQRPDTVKDWGPIVEKMRQVVSLRPQTRVSMMALAEYRAGRPAEALPWVESAMAVDGPEPKASDEGRIKSLFVLSMVYWQLKRHEDAQIAFKTAENLWDRYDRYHRGKAKDGMLLPERIWLYWVSIPILRDEAEATLQGGARP